ncbi:MAG: hypothetical protein WC558_02250 [Patulibacter sp.]
MRQPPDADLTAPERRYLERVKPEHWRTIYLGLYLTLGFVVWELPAWSFPAGLLVFGTVALIEERTYRKRVAKMVERADRRALGQPVGPVPNVLETSWLGYAGMTTGVILPLAGAAIGERAFVPMAAVGLVVFVVGAIDPLARRRAAPDPDPDHGSALRAADAGDADR